MTSNQADALSLEKIKEFLPEKFKDLEMEWMEITASTNLLAKEACQKGAVHGTTFFAEQQNKGRGRMGRSFYSPPYCGIYMSVVLQTEECILDTVYLTIAAAVAVYQAIYSVTGIKAGIKWVNDLYLSGKKICGILAEAVNNPEMGKLKGVVLGIGLNYKMPKDGYPLELSETVGALYPYSERIDDRNRLTAMILQQILEVCTPGKRDFCLELYRKHSIVLGKKVYLYRSEGVVEAFVLQIENNGGLLVRHQDGSKEILTTGEVRIRPM